MKLVIIRHGDPDYEKDSLTPKGWREAELLADRISRLDVKDFYCSPLGRAQATAGVTLKKMNRKAETLDWLEEFPARVLDPETGERRIAWDLMPSYWTNCPELYDREKWLSSPIMKTDDVEGLYRRVADGIDSVLERHGYRRTGMYYRAEHSSRDTLVFFCHLGAECVMVSHLLGISTPVLWQEFFVAPTSVTTLVTEERRKGEACFRCTMFGDTSHLYAGGEPVSSSGLFQEVWED